MTVRIQAIRNSGKLETERLVLGVTSATDIGEFMAFRAAAQGGMVTTNITHMFWFPDKPIRAGDIVVLYTKAGSEKRRVNKNGSTSHFFYWGNLEPIWSDPDYVAVIAHIDEWNSTLVSDEVSEERTEGTPAGDARQA